MSEAILPIHPEDIQLTHSKTVVCDGKKEGETHGGHPKVVLTMVDNPNGEPSHVTCPYCSRVFRYQYAPQVIEEKK